MMILMKIVEKERELRSKKIAVKVVKKQTIYSVFDLIYEYPLIEG